VLTGQGSPDGLMCDTAADGIEVGRLCRNPVELQLVSVRLAYVLPKRDKPALVVIVYRRVTQNSDLKS
jgi:hypothetical protein